MYRRKLSSQHGRDNRGFTLAELLIALGIVAVLFAVATPAFRHTTELVQLKASARQLSGLLRYVREQAIMLGQPHAVMIEEPSKKYWVAAETDPWETPGVLKRLSPGIEGQLGHNVSFRKIKIAVIQDRPRTPTSQTAIYFYEDGTTTPTEIVLAIGDTKPLCHMELSSTGKVRLTIED